MKFSTYFIPTRERKDRIDIKMEWIEHIFYSPLKEVVQDDDRIKRVFIEEVGKYLGIVVLEDQAAIHNAFFDRSYKPVKQ